MFLRTNRAGRSTVRLGLESLESRTLLSATAITSFGTTQATIQNTTEPTIQIASTTPAKTGYAYHWTISPGTVLLGTNHKTGNGKSTGSVAFPLFRDGTATAPSNGSAGSLPIGYVQTTSYASVASPDHYNTSFSLTLSLQDSASGARGKVTFKGTITGTINYETSSLKITFQDTTQKLTLGKHVYTVTIPKTIVPPKPGYPAMPITVKVQVSPKVST